MPLDSLPQDVLHLITFDLAERSIEPDVALCALACVSRSLRPAIVTLRTGAITLPVNLSLRAMEYYFDRSRVQMRRDTAGDVVIKRAGAPGHALVVFSSVPTSVAVTWWFRVEKLAGRRIDIGVATVECVRSGSLQRAHATLFDCFGRAHVQGVAHPYGRQMRTGDLIGVMLHSGRVRFLDGYQTMGPPLPVPVGACVPVVYFGAQCNEALTLVRLSGRDCVSRVASDPALWKRLKDLPYDRRLIVSTWDEEVWYALAVCWTTTTIEDVFHELAHRQKLAPDQLQIIYRGKCLQGLNATLQEVEIVLDERTGTHAHDLHLSIPHLVS